jgi:hypothetical protein
MLQEREQAEEFRRGNSPPLKAKRRRQEFEEPDGCAEPVRVRHALVKKPLPFSIHANTRRRRDILGPVSLRATYNPRFRRVDTLACVNAGQRPIAQGYFAGVGK